MNKLQLQQFINEHWGINIKTLHFVLRLSIFTCLKIMSYQVLLSHVL